MFKWASIVAPYPSWLSFPSSLCCPSNNNIVCFRHIGVASTSGVHLRRRQLLLLWQCHITHSQTRSLPTSHPGKIFWVAFVATNTHFTFDLLVLLRDHYLTDRLWCTPRGSCSPCWPLRSESKEQSGATSPCRVSTRPSRWRYDCLIMQLPVSVRYGFRM